MSKAARGRESGGAKAPAPEEGAESGGSRRLDKWLFCARFFRTRAAAAEAAASGAVRRNGIRCDKPGLSLNLGDVLTIRRSGDVALARVVAFSDRRGGAEEARRLYQEIGSDHAEPALAPDGSAP